jgi:sRNA-binding protein
VLQVLLISHHLFREWAQKTLEEEEKRQEEEKRKKEAEKEKKKLLMEQQQLDEKDPENATVPVIPHHRHEKIKSLKKNFASLDCGAKVVGANPESQGSGNIISNSRYMIDIETS